MRAISKFKGLLHKDSTPSSPSQPAQTSRPQAQPPAKEKEAEAEAKVNDHVAAVLRERAKFLATRSTQVSLRSTADENGHAHETEPLFLGIGTGSIDGPSTQTNEAVPVADIVSDSPTAVDFNVYDRAFEAEVDRIKQSNSRRKGTGPLYHTKHLHEKEQYQSDDTLTVCSASRLITHPISDVVALLTDLIPVAGRITQPDTGRRDAASSQVQPVRNRCEGYGRPEGQGHRRQVLSDEVIHTYCYGGCNEKGHFASTRSSWAQSWSHFP